MYAKNGAKEGKSLSALPKARPKFCCWNHLNSSRGEVLIGGRNQNMKFFSQSLSSVISTPILSLFNWNNKKRGSILKIYGPPLCLRHEVDIQGSAVQLPPKTCHKSLKTTTKQSCAASSSPSSSSLTCKSPALPCSPQLFMHRAEKQAVKSAMCSPLIWRSKHLKSSVVNLQLSCFASHLGEKKKLILSYVSRLVKAEHL